MHIHYTDLTETNKGSKHYPIDLDIFNQQYLDPPA